jgi:hypothetical protein
MAAFGATALLLGALGLLRPDALLGVLGFEAVGQTRRAPGDHTRLFVMVSSMASFNMGVYYLLAMATDWRPFFRFTVAFRLLTSTVFGVLVIVELAPVRFLAVALWEGVGAVATLLALAYEGRRRLLDTDRRTLGVVSNP